MRTQITQPMVDLLNKKLEKEGSTLRYVEDFVDSETICYKVTLVDKFVDNSKSFVINTTKEFEEYVREFFMSYGVEKTGYVNTVQSIFAVKNI